MTEDKSNRQDRSELCRFDLSSIWNEVPADHEFKIIELRRGASVRDRLQREKLLRASEGMDTGPMKVAA